MKKVVVRVGGGLGNQMFEYALGCALAKRTGRTLCFDLTDFIVFLGGRTFQLSNFAGPSRVRHWNFIRSGLFLAAWVVNKRLSRRAFLLMAKAMNIRMVESEKIFEFDPQFVDDRFASAKELLYVNGCYGHVPYLPDEGALREDFRLVSEPSDSNRAYLEKVRSASSVSVHIRRSDYLGVAGGSIVLDLAYYENAMDVIRQRVAEPLWVFFSDDISWCRSTFAGLKNALFVEGNGDAPWEDLRIMSACQHHIIANSTFSWWGAFLGRDPGGVTVYPDHWFPTLRTGPTMVKEQWVSAPSFVGKRCLPSEQP